MENILDCIIDIRLLKMNLDLINKLCDNLSQQTFYLLQTQIQYVGERIDGRADFDESCQVIGIYDSIQKAIDGFRKKINHVYKDQFLTQLMEKCINNIELNNTFDFVGDVFLISEIYLNSTELL